MLDRAEGGEGRLLVLARQSVYVGPHISPSFCGGMLYVVSDLSALGADLVSHAALHLLLPLHSAHPRHFSDDAILDLQEDAADDNPRGLELRGLGGQQSQERRGQENRVTRTETIIGKRGRDGKQGRCLLCVTGSHPL